MEQKLDGMGKSSTKDCVETALYLYFIDVGTLYLYHSWEASISLCTTARVVYPKRQHIAY